MANETCEIKEQLATPYVELKKKHVSTIKRSLFKTEQTYI